MINTCQKNQDLWKSINDIIIIASTIMSTEEQPPAPVEGGEPPLSKNALKKKLKAEKAAKAKAEKAAAKVRKTNLAYNIM